MPPALPLPADPPGRLIAREIGHILVTGRVQGVGYRAWTAREAERRGLAGWVHNREDGAVEAVFAGEPAAVAAMIEACKVGPRGAAVSKIAFLEPSADPPPGFRIIF